LGWTTGIALANTPAKSGWYETESAALWALINEMKSLPSSDDVMKRYDR
jgi:hypothetical protein